MANSFGKILKITTFGESHGKAVGVIIDGVPSNINISLDEIQNFLDERSQLNNPFTTPRKEEDIVEILSGIYQGKTLGTPISLIVYNKNQKSSDYDNLKTVFRPSHADFTYFHKYQHVDKRGGGRSSARETLARVAASSIAYKILQKENIHIKGFVARIGNLSINNSNIDYNEISNNYFFSPDKQIVSKWQRLLENTIKEGDSIGGLVEIHIKNLPIGLGEPIFDKINASLAKAIFSIPAVKSLEFGEGLDITYKKGSEANDSFKVQGDKISPNSNKSGGILGGITSGEDIIMRIGIKPTSSIAKLQSTVNSDLQIQEISIKGRHDPCIAIRATPVIKAMCALTIADFLLINKVYQ